MFMQFDDVISSVQNFAQHITNLEKEMVKWFPKISS
jgi:hypothetical protein